MAWGKSEKAGRVLMSGEATAVRGVVLSIYLFRNTDPTDLRAQS